MSSNGGTSGHGVVRTLRQAHEQVAREWPGRHASAAVFRAYYEQAALWYEQVARVDPDHRHEALYWAGQEREAARSCVEHQAVDAP